MSDLISRSALLESLMHCDGLGRKSFDAVLQTINELPTVEAIPKKKMQEIVERFENYSIWKELLIYDLTHREREIIRKAIEIVKEAGGVNEL